MRNRRRQECSDLLDLGLGDLKLALGAAINGELPIASNQELRFGHLNGLHV
jgi:hypothetical protein